MIVIQTQSKKGLTQIEEIAVNEKNTRQLIVWPGWKIVGEFETPERALEVIELVRQAINNGYRTFEIPKE